MDLSTKTDSISKLKDLVNKSKDKEAYEFFKDLYFKQPLVLANGGDTELGEICNPIGFEILHASKQWQREIEWWQAVVNILEGYDKANNVNLHKGLAYHNIVLPLLELNKPKTAVDYLKKAIKEDHRNFSEEEAKKRPAYKLGCFLIPIVMTGRWRDNDSRISQDEIRQLIDSFEVMFKLISDANQFPSMQQALQGIDDEDLKETLLKRYGSIERHLDDDAVMVAVYAGSVIEGLLTVLLKKDHEQAIQEFRRQAEQRPNFIFYLHNEACDVLPGIINQKAPEEANEEVKRRAIDTWEFGQKIAVAQKLGIFGQQELTALFILCHLLREYRNIVHPSNKDTLGLSREWEITFKLEPQIARMLKGALDVVLSLLGSQDLSQYQIAGKLSETESRPTSPGVFVTQSGINSQPTLNSLASPGIPGGFDEKGYFTPSPSTSPSEPPVMGSPGIPGDPDEDDFSSNPSKPPGSTQTYSTTSSRSPVMGSTTTTTTLPNEGKQEQSH